MTNKEFFKEQLLDIACKGDVIAVNEKTGVPMSCNYPNCFGCLFNNIEEECGTQLSNWCKADYNYESFWKTVKVDAKILVNGSRRHFAKYENGLVYYYAHGESSFTNDYPLGSCPPCFVKLV